MSSRRGVSWTGWVGFTLFVGAALFGSRSSAADAIAPWATYRGNPERTGNTDGKMGPAAPKVLWTFKTQEHFITAPVPLGERVLISGLGGFNAPVFYSLAADPAAVQRVAWSRTVPDLKQATVSSPGVAAGKLVFGDGMHHLDGGALHCIRSDGGMPLWQLPVPGSLVHLEGSPTIADGKVYIGGGAAGVLCVHLDRVTLDGKEQDLATVQKILDQKWKELQVKYEEAKKKDPDFAVPPSLDQLPKAAPVKCWQQGQEKWHVDAPVAVAGDNVLVASAFLDKEKVGDRAVFCLDAKTGAIRWRTPLKLNPWGGPSVLGNLVVVSGSTIGYDPTLLKHGKGEVVALNLSDGSVKWQKPVTTGGIVSCVALANGLAVTTATDGKIRAFSLDNGERRWIYEGIAPFFAAPAIAGGVVYAGDLRGGVHAVSLANGEKKWVLDLAQEPVKTPGMIYGGPALQDGRLYVATCNLQGTHAGKPTAVVCLGEK